MTWQIGFLELLVVEAGVFPGFGVGGAIGGDERREEGDGDVPVGDGVYLEGGRGRSAALETAGLAAVAGARSGDVCHG